MVQRGCVSGVFAGRNRRRAAAVLPARSAVGRRSLRAARRCAAQSDAINRDLPMPRFLLLPGLDGTGDLLRDFAAQLEVLGPVEVLCYPGAGAQDYATLLRGLQARVRIDADCVILAESFAGPLGMALAAQAAVVPRALVLCATFAASPQPWLRPLAPLLDWLPLQALPDWAKALPNLGTWITRARSRQLGAALRPLPQPVLRQRLRSALLADGQAALAATRCPLLYLQASADCVVPPWALRRVAALRPDVRCVRIRAPHFLLQAAPAQAVAAIRTFLAQLPPPAG
ncbi:alpha/beta fold hydrolase [Tahibacter harae]|uniref:Lysophospholipase n=1 Tax=Tahibacter harae TaxID=2963937 RepID=A0ABT1QQF6_9GAMM|nr:alpha/beta hydrolase [Tahibacter harae]MCQ4164538.1 lysophospholipase [Tahibacter harae]